MIQPKGHIILLTTSALGFLPFVVHKAIKFYTIDGQPYVLHLTTSGTELVDFDSFLKNRTIYAEEDIPVKESFDPEYILAHDKRKFDWMNNNCEDFTSRVVSKATGKKCFICSPQRTFWMGLLLLILITLILIR